MNSIAIDIDRPDQQPITLELLKLDLRITEDNLDEVITEQYLPGAVLEAEAFWKRSVVSRTHRWILSDFPRTGMQLIKLPRGQCTAIESVAYSSGGAITTLTGPTSAAPGTDWQEDLRADSGGRLMPNRGSSWPSVDADVPAPITITYSAGWLVANVPKSIRHNIVVRVYRAMELDELLATRPSFDADLVDKIGSEWRIF